MKNMKIVIFGGTSEGRELSCELAKAGAEVVVSVASDYGVEEQGSAEGVTVECGPKEEAEIRAMIADADAVIDATHPYAVIVTDNIRKAAEDRAACNRRTLRGRVSPDPCWRSRIHPMCCTLSPLFPRQSRCRCP